MNAYLPRLLAAGLFLLLFSINAYGAGLWLYEQATPDMGSASAGRVALASDASTAAVNPAGMTRLERSQMLGGLNRPYFSRQSRQIRLV
jgi:long-chain fatty acid transport protein